VIINHEMSHEPFPDDSAETTWTPPLDPEEEQAEQEAAAKLATVGQELSTMGLVAAGSAAVNFLLTLACIAVWLMDQQSMLTAVAGSNGLWILLGLIAVGLGGYIQRIHKRAGVKGGLEATVATTAILSGMLIMSTAVMLPLISAIQNMLGSSAAPLP
jgi:hypothetical protein